METKITKEIKDRYLADPANCPFCGHFPLYADPSFESVDYIKAHRIIKCPNCGKKWMEVYTLSDIED